MLALANGTDVNIDDLKEILNESAKDILDLTTNYIKNKSKIY